MRPKTTIPQQGQKLSRNYGAKQNNTYTAGTEAE